MKILESIRNAVSGAFLGLSTGAKQFEAMSVMAEEGAIAISAHEAGSDLASLELMVEDMAWRELHSGQSGWNFSRSTIAKMVALSRLLYIANPLIKRAVTVQELYVWGSGCKHETKDENIEEVLNDFYDDPKNQAVIGAAWDEREREQRNTGNTFFVLFWNRATGAVRVRLIPVEEIIDIYSNPEDSKDVWFYKRVMPSGTPLLYPDIDYQPSKGRVPENTEGVPINWEARVLHVKTGGLSEMKFGIPELFSTLNWARAYKGILENFATILAAYARIAMQITNQKNKKDVAASKSKLGTTVGSSNYTDGNPPENAGSTFLASGGLQISAVKTANSTTGPDEARALRSMVAAGSDTPEHFFGDSDIGNFATSTTLDRPTELKMIGRQNMWKNVMCRFDNAIIRWSAQAPQGKLRKAGFTVQAIPDSFDGTIIYKVIPPKDVDMEVTHVFPNILERGVVERVRAVVQAVTLGGSKAEGIVPDRKYVAKLLLTALGEDNVDEVVDLMYPAPITQGFVDPAEELKIKKIAAEKPLAAAPASN